MSHTTVKRVIPRVDPAFIAGVSFLRPACSVNDIATILGCDRKRVLTVLARLAEIGLRSDRDPAAPRYRALTPAQQAEATLLHGNGRGLDFYAICRVMRDTHPLALFTFIQTTVGPRGWWVRPCLACGALVPTPDPATRVCAGECGALGRALASA